MKTIEVDCKKCLDVGGSSYPISTKGRLKSFKCDEYVIIDNNNEKEWHDKWREPDIVCDLNRWHNIDMGYQWGGYDLDETFVISKNFRERLYDEKYESYKEVDGVFEKDGKLFRIQSGDKQYIDVDENIELELHGRFDCVFCLEVFEYILFPFWAMRHIEWLTDSGGILYISFPFSYAQHNPLANDYLRLTPRGVEKLLEESGFEVIEHILRETTEKQVEAYRADGMRMAKGANHRCSGSLIKARKK